MIISIYALKSGMIRVVQQTLLGSILSNMLLVLGCAFFTGGIVHYQKVQVFNKVYSMTSLKLLHIIVSSHLCPLHFTEFTLYLALATGNCYCQFWVVVDGCNGIIISCCASLYSLRGSSWEVRIISIKI